ncbi:MAG: cold shock domain-containing protein [Mariniblastus sp.]|nr:cold shock domain-containing protein [Mariniblastus sp.]
MNRIAFLGLACLLICALTPLTTSAQDKTDTKASADTQTTRSNGTVKFFNNSKGFGFISNDQGMDVLLEKVAAILGGPTTGCTFEIMDILNDVFSGTYGVGNEVTSNALVRKRPTL